MPTLNTNAIFDGDALVEGAWTSRVSLDVASELV